MLLGAAVAAAALQVLAAAAAAVAVASTAITAAAHAGGGLEVTVATDGSYAVKVGGTVWLEGADTWITAGGEIFGLHDGSLTLAQPLQTSTGRDALGAYTRTSLELRASTRPTPTAVVFSIKQWADGETVEFVQAFPHGLADSAAASRFSPALPALPCTTVPQPCSGARHAGRFYCNSTHTAGQCSVQRPSVNPGKWCVGNTPVWFSNNISLAGCRDKATTMAANGTADAFDYSPWPGNATGQPGGTCGGVADCAQCRVGVATAPVKTNLQYSCYVLNVSLPCPPCAGPHQARTPGNPNAVSTSFPSWRPTNLHGAPKRGWMAYDGWDCDGKHGTCLVQNKANVDPSSAHVAFGQWGVHASADDVPCTATLLKQLSDKGQCHAGQTFGCANGSIWTKDCRGVFQCDPGTRVTCSVNAPVVNGTRHCPCDGGSAGGLPDGLEGSGPMAIFSEDLSTTLVVSAFTNTMAQSQLYDLNDTTLHYGLLGSVTDVPAGWSSSVILSLGKGPNQAVRRWGKKLLQFYSKELALSRADFISTHLGFDTDNGAFYYYHTEQNKSFEDTLLDVHAYSQRVGLPYRHVQIDSWWYIKGKDSGTKTWSPAPNTFPGDGHSGLQRLHNQTGWVYTAHNRMWSGEVTYAKANGCRGADCFDFVVPEPGGQQGALPMTEDFWLWLIGDSVKWGLQMYEQDWLYTEFTGVNGTLLHSATLGRQWLMQMDRGVHEHNLGLQLCMAWPRHVLQSLEMASVTQGRASSDYNVKSEQWRIGDNALFLDSIALRPTKDCFRSNQTSGEMFPRLQGAVSSLSGGPVFACDEIGTSDVALIMRSCDADGELLQPTHAAAPIDANIRWKTGMTVPGAGSASGEIWKADSWIDGDEKTGLHFPQILAAASGPYSLDMTELLDEGEAASPAGFVAVEANSSHTGAMAVSVNASTPLALPKTDKSTFNLWSLAPRLPSGWALLGECTSKWVPVSTRRFEDVADDVASGLSVRVKGVPGETVFVSAVAPHELRIRTASCLIAQGGVALAHFDTDSASCAPV
jgi:hypothetical protein